MVKREWPNANSHQKKNFQITLQIYLYFQAIKFNGCKLACNKICKIQIEIEEKEK